MRTFEELLNKLNKKSFQDIMKEYNEEDVECIENEVYEDDDLYNFMCSIGAEIEDFGVGFALISTNNGNYYEVPYECKENRFGDDLPDETILYFDIDRIYDVTSEHK